MLDSESEEIAKKSTQTRGNQVSQSGVKEAEGKYLFDEMVGEWKYYSPSGELESTEYYEEWSGRKEGGCVHSGEYDWGYCT